MNKYIVIFVIVVLIVLGGYILMSQNDGTPSPSESSIENDQESDLVTATPTTSASPASSTSPSPTAKNSASPKVSPTTTPKTTQSAVKTFTVSGNNFAFDVKEIKVKKGDTVKIVFKNTTGFHDWVIDEFNARTQKIQGGQSETIQFVADKTGTFEYYCSVGTHRQQGMKGNLIVE